MSNENRSDDIFQNLRDSISDFGKKVGNFMDDALSSDMSGGELKVRTDVYSTKDSFVIELEVPGIKKEEVSIQIHDGVLNVKGEKKVPEGREENVFEKQERRFGFFLRSFPLPVSAVIEKVKAKYESGILTIRFPRNAEAEDAGDINIE